MPTRIVVDEREKKSGIPDLLRQAGAVIDFAQLKVGDYIVSPETAIERKTIHDLLHSVYDGRLFVQCSQLNEHYVKPVLIVEGNILDLIDIQEDVEAGTERRQGKEEEQSVESRGDTAGEHKRFKPLSEKIPLIYDALAKVALDFRIPLVCTPSADYTSQLLIVMVNKSLQNGLATGPLLKRIKKGNAGLVQQLSILSSVPGVGDKLAARMLDKFQTPIRALNASAAELSRISGFGTERAARVRRILDLAIGGHDRIDTLSHVEEYDPSEKGLEVIQRTLLDDPTINKCNQNNSSKL